MRDGEVRTAILNQLLNSSSLIDNVAIDAIAIEFNAAAYRTNDLNCTLTFPEPVE